MMTAMGRIPKPLRVKPSFLTAIPFPLQNRPFHINFHSYLSRCIGGIKTKKPRKKNRTKKGRDAHPQGTDEL